MCTGCSDSFYSDPVSYALAAQQQSQSMKIAFSVQATAQKTQKQVGEAMVGLIDAAAQLGKAIDKGLNFDASA